MNSIDQAYKALQSAAERMGQAEYKRQTSLRKGRKLTKFSPTSVLAGTITPDEAMALLWDYDVMKQRLAS